MSEDNVIHEALEYCSNLNGASRLLACNLQELHQVLEAASHISDWLNDDPLAAESFADWYAQHAD